MLASASPRRRELLASLGLTFTVEPADVDESVLPGEGPAELVSRLAAAKVEALAGSYPGSLVIAADTTVVVDGRVINKPSDANENAEFLRRLSGSSHDVLTGHAFRLGDMAESRVVRTRVRFRELTSGEIERYVVSGEGMDKAGGYAIQGLGAAHVAEIEGSYTNVVGLCLPTVVESARRLGVEVV